MKQIRGKSLVGTAFDVVHSSIHYSGFLLLVIAFTDVYVRYERVAETQQQLNDELAKFDEIQREEIGERHRRAVKDDNVVVAGIEKKFAQLELRYNQFHEIKIGGHGWRESGEKGYPKNSFRNGTYDMSANVLPCGS